jgi:predicted nucleotidyltransferase
VEIAIYPRDIGKKLSESLFNTPLGVNKPPWFRTPKGILEMALTDLEIPSQGLESLCRKWRVRELSLFGSVLRDDFTPESDVDVLVSFDPDATWSLWDLTEMRDELIALIGRPVDLVEREGLQNPFRRDKIMQTRKVIYVARKG